MRLLSLLLLGSVAHAHGINGHVHVTGWAIERLPEGELKAFFADPEVRDAALIGAAFPDSGYAIDDGYGELAHWAPYVEAHVAWLRQRVGPPFADLEARKHAAFLMGLACHGLQDEMFDSLFLFQVQAHDGEGQSRADPGTDAFLWTDGWLQYRPPLYAPFDDLPEIFRMAHGHAVEAGTIRTGMNRIKALVIDGFGALAPSLDAQHRPHLPWTADHYVDPAIPGSLAAEIPATGAFLQALWDRMHDRFPVAGLGVHTWPDPPRRLLGRAPSVDSWITVVFGAGAWVGSLTPDTVELLDPVGMPVPMDVRHTRWGGSPDDSTRLVRVLPEVELAPDTEYTVRLLPGVALVDGRALEAAWTFSFLTPCEAGEPACAPEPMGGEPPRPPDAGPDAAPVDAGPPDAAFIDASRLEMRVSDVSVETDAAVESAPPAPTRGGGDGCQVGFRP